MLTKDNQSQNQSEPSQSNNKNDFLEGSPDSPISLEDLLKSSDNLVEPKRQKGGWRSLGLRTKTTILAVLIGTLPVLLIGGTAYLFSSRSLDERVQDTQQQKTNAIAGKLNQFIYDRYGDIQVLANHPILTNRKVQAVMPQAERESILNDYAKTYGVYNLIAFADLDGSTPIRSTITADPASNIKERDFFKNALATGKPFVSQPGRSTVTKRVSLFISAPVKEVNSDKFIGVVRTRMPIENLTEIIKTSVNDEDEYHLIDATGKIFLATEKTQEDSKSQEDFPKLAEAINNKTALTTVDTDRFNGKEQLVTYVPLPNYRNMPNLNMGVIIAIDTSFAFKPQRDLLITIATGTGFTALLVGFIAAIIANRAVKPIQEAAKVVSKIGQGDLDTRLEVLGDDELGTLSSNINGMVEQLKYLSEAQQQEAERLENARKEARAEADARAEEQKQEKEMLQRRALELLIEVDPVSRGDLTIRANVTADEVGTIADSYNAIIRNLRKLVLEVQSATQSVTQTASDNEVSVRSVSNEAIKQSVSINLALQEIKQMAESSRGVEDKAKQAEQGMQVAATVLLEGDEAMNRTVLGISEIRETVSETAKKVKRLGETSQKISRIVNLISNFAAQTNLLALNAAIEAARAGEEGRGFSVVAEEVRDLAEQSANSTAEIEQLVEEIQAQTNEVVAAMETGTEQVVSGTKLVQNAREKLTKISTVSKQVNSLVQAIATAADTQTKASNRIGDSMQSIAAIAEDTSKQSEDVAQSFSELLQVAQNLQVSVAQFKVA
ncbi:methyl-accepting chemotaxis protein [Pseudanabaena sp. FACHB-1998]|uniref:methyl-accepting chemotaxis protein n=1 Tax=Pseudanabaena sp. FACHB-1998 TaxID=2692858 RepID=UPI0016812C60|nr:methyl-accepting chemotaxis protein [Pseudanabaena sp. FACHB-1998]MBD2177581.1 methyl-accepting chemotaxis protein [Pseudanabaena sp. FACHB-1998]